jgi:hypothetical protein
VQTQNGKLDFNGKQRLASTGRLDSFFINSYQPPSVVAAMVRLSLGLE